jgi:glycosyltransferase involved in cell wall biosynthesis
LSSPAISVVIPTYNQHALLLQTIHSVLGQSFEDFEVIVADDCSTDDTEDVVRNVRDGRVSYHKNSYNLGYGRNLQANSVRATGDVLFLLGHDDILLPGALRRTYEPFVADGSVVLVTRPYYWFVGDIRDPVRAVTPLDPGRDAKISLQGGRAQVQALFRSAGQLSGLAYRRSELRMGFHHHIFPAHVYPLADVMKRGVGVYLKDYTVAVRMESSMTRHRSDIYDVSPTATWMEMFDTVYDEPEFDDAKRFGKELLLAQNYEGLFQLRNYAGLTVLVREMSVLLRHRPLNALSARFWLISLLCLATPRPLLIKLVDAFKRRVLAPGLGSISDDISESAR